MVEGTHLIFGTGHEEIEDWEGSVNAIKEETNAIKTQMIEIESRNRD
jgi:hypothetical protein